MSILGVYRKIKRLFKARTNQADKSSLLGVPVKTANWLPDNTGVMIYNGVDNVVRLDGTDKEARYEVKKPRMVIFHTGVTPNLAKWRLSQQDTRSTKKPTKGDQEIATPHQPQRGGK